MIRVKSAEVWASLICLRKSSKQLQSRPNKVDFSIYSRTLDPYSCCHPTLISSEPS